MRRRLLAICLRAYPRATRERDGAFLVDLSLELGTGTRLYGQALSLLRGGLGERARRSRPAALLGATVVAGAVVLGGVALTASHSEQVEVRACAVSSDSDCGGAGAWAEDRERHGWSCSRSASDTEVSWQCEAP